MRSLAATIGVITVGVVVLFAAWIWFKLPTSPRRLDINEDGGVMLLYQTKGENPDMDALITAIRKRIDPASAKQVTVFRTRWFMIDILNYTIIFADVYEPNEPKPR